MEKTCKFKVGDKVMILDRESVSYGNTSVITVVEAEGFPYRARSSNEFLNDIFNGELFHEDQLRELTPLEQLL